MSRFAAPLLLALLGTGWLAIAGCASTSPTNETRDETGDEAGQADVLRVATWNIKHGRGMDGRLDLERTATVLAALKADIIALQEVDETVRRSGRVDQAAWLAERLEMHASFGAFMDYQGGRYGLAILSRFPIEHAETWRLTDGNEPRVAQAIQVALPSGDVITGVCVHFDWVDDDGFRFAQASETMARLRELDTPWIVLGDFNALSGHDSVALTALPEQLEKSRRSDAEHGHVENLRNGEFDFAVMQSFFDAGLVDLQERFLDRAPGARWTFTTGIWSEEKRDAPEGGTRIDYVLASPEMAGRALGARVVREGVVNRASDHYPVIVDFDGE